MTNRPDNTLQGWADLIMKDNQQTSASNQQLEPCPFCGSPAHIRTSVVDARRTEKQFEYFVACTNSYSKNCPLFPRAMNPRSTEIEAVTDWNYRSRVSDGGVVATVDKGARKLTKPELNHLINLLEAERESGEYAGPREQYYARTGRLIEWCNEQIGAK